MTPVRFICIISGLEGRKGCFAFIPLKSRRDSEAEAAAITNETTFVSNATWINLTAIIDNYRRVDSQNRFIIQVEKRGGVSEDMAKEVIYIG